MPEWITSGVWVAPALTLAAALIGYYVAGWKNKKDFQLALIDQMQEERKYTADLLNTERTERRAEVATLNGRVDSLLADKAASREYVAILKDHIWRRQEPPPPEPPPGYLP